MTTTKPHSDTLRHAMLQNIADALANDAADTSEPLAGLPINDEARTELATMNA